MSSSSVQRLACTVGLRTAQYGNASGATFDSLGAHYIKAACRSLTCASSLSTLQLCSLCCSTAGSSHIAEICKPHHLFTRCQVVLSPQTANQWDQPVPDTLLPPKRLAPVCGPGPPPTSRCPRSPTTTSASNPTKSDLCKISTSFSNDR